MFCRCVMKMDHHCPWINNCVGHYNHAYFTYFLFFAPMGCMHALLILIPAMYRAVNRVQVTANFFRLLEIFQICLNSSFL